MISRCTPARLAKSRHGSRPRTPPAPTSLSAATPGPIPRYQARTDTSVVLYFSIIQ
jgi:hypothetical protein